MKHIVEYKMHGDNIPFFIEDGGYFPSENGKMIGLTRCDTCCYVPSSTELVTFSTKQSFIDYIVAQNIATLTTEEKTQMASDFWDSKCL